MVMHRCRQDSHRHLQAVHGIGSLAHSDRSLLPTAFAAALKPTSASLQRGQEEEETLSVIIVYTDCLEDLMVPAKPKHEQNMESEGAISKLSKEPIFWLSDRNCGSEARPFLLPLELTSIRRSHGSLCMPR